MSNFTNLVYFFWSDKYADTSSISLPGRPISFNLKFYFYKAGLEIINNKKYLKVNICLCIINNNICSTLYSRARNTSELLGALAAPEPLAYLRTLQKQLPIIFSKENPACI